MANALQSLKVRFCWEDFGRERNRVFEWNDLAGFEADISNQASHFDGFAVSLNSLSISLFIRGKARLLKLDDEFQGIANSTRPKINVQRSLVCVSGGPIPV